MVFTKTLVQTYSQDTVFSFSDLIRGTLSLIQYGLDNKINIRLNLEGSPFADYVTVTNYVSDGFPVHVFSTEDSRVLYETLEDFRLNDAALILVSTNWSIHPSRVSELAILEFKTLLQFTLAMYEEAASRAANELLNIKLPHVNPVIVELLPLTPVWTIHDYGLPAPTDYCVIFVDIHPCVQLNYLDTLKLADTIRCSLLFDKNIILLSNVKRLKNRLSKLLEVAYVQTTLQTGDERFQTLDWSLEDEVVNFILLANAKKIYTFSEQSMAVDRFHVTASRLMSTSVQLFPFFYSRVEISPMP